MISARGAFYEHLLNEFSKEGVYNTCLESSLKQLKGELTTRLFDDFPPLLTEPEIDLIAGRLKQILITINHVKKTSHGIELVYYQDRAAIKQWQLNIIQKGCEALLGDDGQICNDLIELLGWQDYRNKIDNCILVCAFAHGIHQAIIPKLADFINVNCQDAYSAVCHLIHTQVSTWVIDTFKRKNIPYDEKYEKSIFDSPNLKFAIGVGAGATVLGIGSLAALGILFFGGVGAQPVSADISLPNSLKFS